MSAGRDGPRKVSFSSASGLSVSEAAATCWLCRSAGSERSRHTLLRNCACAGDEGFAHLHCLVKAAEADWRGRIDCPACNETCYGEIQLVRARKHWVEVRRRPVGDVERELAAELLATSLRICIGSGEAGILVDRLVMAGTLSTGTYVHAWLAGVGTGDEVHAMDRGSWYEADVLKS